MGYLCDNIGLVLVCLPSGSTDVTTLLVIPIFPFCKIRRIFDLLVIYIGTPRSTE